MEQTILKKAAELFIKFGFKSVTMDDIANELTISKKTIYVYYENKSELVEAVVNYFFEEITKIIQGIISLNLNAIEESFKIHETVSQLFKDENESIEYQLRKYFPEIHEKNNCTRTDLFQQTISNNLEKGISEGYYRPSIDVNFTSKFFIATITSLKNNDNSELVDYPITYAKNQFFDIYFRGIVTEKGLEILKKQLNK
ncbi:MAG: TetR/AcrR family transcriptional regulator [Bacteroidetes bacterium]|nr:TetR/AcrR family transcriptional regulator [Bacteroidota bacterium]MCM2302917.1 TetR/AcrR family transcriptional regulator [Flavobacteriaceae bacterium]